MRQGVFVPPASDARDEHILAEIDVMRRELCSMRVLSGPCTSGGAVASPTIRPTLSANRTAAQIAV